MRDSHDGTTRQGWRWLRTLVAAVSMTACGLVATVVAVEPAGAAPCMTCPDDPPPPPSPPHTPRLTYTVTMGAIHAYETEDLGDDETELYLNGELIFDADMSSGEEQAINRVRNVYGTFRVALYDEDGPFDDDDRLGEVAFNPAISPGDHLVSFTEDDAFYTVSLNISPAFWT